MSRYSPQTDGIRLRRLGAFLIDVGAFLLVLRLWSLTSTWGVFGLVPVLLIYRALFALARRPTVGHRVMSLTIEATDGQTPRRRRILARDLPYAGGWLIVACLSAVFENSPRTSVTQEAIPALVFLGLITLAVWDVVVGLSSGHQALHDIWAGTRVVAAPNRRLTRQPTSP